jgi:DNA processing protein
MQFKNITVENLLGALNEVEEKNAPKEIFVRGDSTLFRKHMSVSIVGSRKASPEGISRAKTLAKTIVSRGGIVVSGLAEGIDTAAHTGAINAGGQTVAVIGTPLDQTYPKANAELQEKIATEHLLISQFPIGYPSMPKNFVLRNRTMALISDATVIVEASEKSGTIHQGWEAIRLGRPLFVMESLLNKNLKWVNEFLDYGAEVLTRDKLDDFFSMLPATELGGYEPAFII